MSERIRSDAQKFTHDNYAAVTAPATKTLPAACTALLIDNVDASATVSISFDGGVKYKAIKPSTSLSVDVDSIKSYMVKSSAASSNVECLYASEN